MSDDYPDSFNDGEFGWVPGVLIGGPFDGQRYRMPLLPDGEIPEGWGRPVQEPHETSPVAWYYREGDEPVGGYYVFLFDQILGPDGDTMEDVPPPHATQPADEATSAPNVSTDECGRLISAASVTKLMPDEVFVFGSNAQGKHGRGAARYAMDHFGAVWGQGHGLHGQSYAIDTMSGLRILADEVSQFLRFAASHPSQVFLVTEIGCGIAGYTPNQIAPFFSGAPQNVALPASFAAIAGHVEPNGPASSAAAGPTPGVATTAPAATPTAATPRHWSSPTASHADSSAGDEDASPTAGAFPNECTDVQHFNTELLRWLSRTPPGARLGESHSQIVTTVPIGRERCLLRGGSTREGVTEYLARVLKGSAPFSVAPSTKNVVHRVTVGRDGNRIRGFYLYTSTPYQEPQVFAAGDGSCAEDRMVAFACDREWLHAMLKDPNDYNDSPLNADEWEERAAGLWDPQDLPATEVRVRARLGLHRSLWNEDMCEPVLLYVRVLFDQGKNEEIP